MRKFLGWALAMTVIIAGACDDDDNNSTPALQQADRDFVSKASEANLAEIELGEMAADRASMPGVKAFGEMMVMEHQMALDELDSLAENKNATMMRELNAEHEQVRQKLMSLTGFSFDTAYINSQVKDHEKTLALFQTQASSGSDAELKAYANKYLPHIRMHLEKADSIDNTFD